MASNDASRMLNAGRSATQPTHEEQVSDPSSAEVSVSDPGSAGAAGEQETRRLVAGAPAKPLAYVKTSFFIRPGQRTWLNTVVARAKLDGLDGISASDVVRLALRKLEIQCTDGLDSHVLFDQLIEQAHVEADLFPGRKNRGLPLRR